MKTNEGINKVVIANKKVPEKEAEKFKTYIVAWSSCKCWTGNFCNYCSLRKCIQLTQD